MRAPSPNQNTLLGHSWKGEQDPFVSYTMGCLARVSSRVPLVFSLSSKNSGYNRSKTTTATATRPRPAPLSNPSSATRIRFIAASDGPEALKLQGGRARASKFLAGLNVPDDKLAELALAQGFDKVIVMARMLLDMLYEARGFNSASVDDMTFTFDASSRHPHTWVNEGVEPSPHHQHKARKYLTQKKNAKNKSGGVGLSRHGSFFHKDIVVTRKHKLRTEALSYELVRVQARGHNLQL